MPSDIHDELSGFAPYVVDCLGAIDFWGIEGQYNPAELVSEMQATPAYRDYKAESKEKNSRVWDIIKGVLVGTAIAGGMASFRKEYPAQVREAELQRAADKKPRLTSQDYQDRYIKEHGGEFIKNLSRADQQKLVNFIWSNRGEHERPMKAKINQQPHLRYVLDQGRHREGTIVRTEKNRATKYGSWKYATDCDFKTKTWQSTNDKRVRPSHRALSGTTIPINEDFGSEGPYPGAVSINCRCHLLYGV